MLWPDGGGSGADPLGLAVRPPDADVTSVEELPCRSDPAELCDLVTFELQSGERGGTVGSMETGTDSQIDPGDDIGVTAVELPDGTTSLSSTTSSARHR